MSGKGGKWPSARLLHLVLARVQVVLLLLTVALLAVAAAIAMLPMLPQEWFKAPPARPDPLAVELIEPASSATSRPTRAMTIGSGGLGTIVSAPGRRLVPSLLQPLIGEPALAREPPVAAQVAGLVRLLARLAPVPPSDELVVTTLDEPPRQFATIILRDGCLRLAEPREPHAVLPPGTKLYVDDEGFLTVGALTNGAATDPRLGEPAWWTGGRPLQIDEAALAQIRAKCGAGDVKTIGPAQSVAASQADADGAAARNLLNMYGLSWTAALEQVRACRVRIARNSEIDPRKRIENPCGSTPPLPVADSRSCPAGTSFSGGLCRTPTGHIRPIPAL